MKAWIYQDAHQVQKVGAERASWYVGWLDPEGKRRCKSCGAGEWGKEKAEKYRKRIEAELLTGTYQTKTNATWALVRQEYENKVVVGMELRTKGEVLHALDQFARIIKPAKMQGITTNAVATFVSERRKERGLKPKSLVSVATINKELRHLRAVFGKAHKWGYLPKMPEFDFLKEPRKLPNYVTPEHFVLIYEGCKSAKLPTELPYDAADWWRGLVVMAYMTGWRIGSLLALRRIDVDFENATATSRAADNKGKRDQITPLHPLVVEHLRKLASFDAVIFPWNHNRRRLFEEFARIQKMAGVKLVGEKDHYTFHDLRRAFATMNAERMTAGALQACMQHRDYQTTQRYINLARQLKPTAQNIYVPQLPKLAVAY